jgi:virulence-associated protein VapD
MYALSFDMEVANLKEHYVEPYNKAYDEIRVVMGKLGFDGHKVVYISQRANKIT